MKKPFLIFLFATMLVLGWSVPTLASTAFTSSTYKDGLGVELTPDQISYKTGSQADVTVKVTNYNDYEVSNVQIQNLLPSGLKLADSQNGSKTISSLAPGASASLEFKVLQIASSSGSSSGSSKASGSQASLSPAGTVSGSSRSASASSGGVSSASQEANPQTGGEQAALCFLLSGTAIVLAAFLLYRIRKGGGHNRPGKKHLAKKSIAMLVAAAMLLPYFSELHAQAADTSGTITLSQSITFNGTSYTLSATVTYDKSSDSQNISTTFTRGEWIDLLLKKLGYDPSSADNDSSNPYYADSSDSKYGKDIEFAYSLGILPAPDNDGYVDSAQDVPLFEPDKTVTREFAAYTAVTALDFSGTYTLDSSDASSAAYPSQDAIAVKEGLLSLESGQFNPSRALSETDKESIFSAIDYLNASTEVDADKTAENITFEKGVIVDPLKKITDYTASENGDGTYTVVLPKTDATSALSTGNVFVLPENAAFPSGTAFKVQEKAASGSSSAVTLICTEPDSSEVIDQFQYSGNAVASPSDFQADSGVTAQYDATSSIDTDSLSHSGIAVSSDLSSVLSSDSDTSSSSSISQSTVSSSPSRTLAKAVQSASPTSKAVSSDSKVGKTGSSSSSASTSSAALSKKSSSSSSSGLSSIQTENNTSLKSIDASGSTSIPGTLNLTFDKEIANDFTVSGTIKMSIPEIACRANLDLNPLSSNHVKDLLVSVTKKAQFEGELKYTAASSKYEMPDTSNSEKEDGKFELGRLPIALGSTGLFISLVVYCSYSAEGTLSLSYTLEDTQGIQVVNGAFRTLHDSSQQLENLELDGTAKAGAALGVSLTYLCFDLIGIDGDGGLAFTASFTAHTDVSPTLYCASAASYVYLTIELNDQTIVPGLLKQLYHLSYSWEIFDKYHSPWHIGFHVENGKIVPKCTYGEGTISGKIENAKTQDPIANARVLILAGDKVIKTLYSDSNGKYEVSDLSSQDYNLKISATGCYTFTTTASVTADHTTYLETLLMVNRGDASSGAVSGNILDAVSGTAVSNVTYTVFKGWNNTSSTQVGTGSVSGNYSLSLAPGNYTIRFTKDGYTENSINVAVVSSVQIGKDVTLSPNTVVNGSTLRIVLTWGETPSDLDSHLFGPSTDGQSEFHTAFYQKDYSENGKSIANLDLDDTTSFGPETTTVYQLNSSGTYKFFVHDYSDEYDSSDCNLLSQSSAQVKVYSDNQLVATYNVPTDTDGTLWHVFDFDASTRKLIPINTFSYSTTPDFNSDIQ